MLDDGDALGFLFNGIESADDTPKRLELFLTGRQIPGELEELEAAIPGAGELLYSFWQIS